MYGLILLIVRLSMRIAFNLHYEGKKNIPKGENFIYTSNHRSNFDPPIVGSGIIGLHAFMAKEELFQNKFLGFLIRALGAFPVSRGKGDMGVIDTSVERLEKGMNLMIFPEGTRSKDGKVGRGHSGAAVIAAKSGKRIIPVGVCFGDKLKFRTRVTVRYGSPIDPADYIDDMENPSTRQIVKLKNRYMADIKALVEGGQPEKPESEKTETEKETENE